MLPLPPSVKVLPSPTPMRLLLPEAVLLERIISGPEALVVLLAMIELSVFKSPKMLKMPPPSAPSPVVELPETVLLLTLRSPSTLRMPPPNAPSPVVELPETVLLLTLRFSKLRMPPPSPVPLRLRKEKPGPVVVVG